ncbi:NAD-dependent epimerase/dehydratase family protein [Gemmatimonadota bacterium]
MTRSRRDFIQTSIVAGGAMSLGMLGCSNGEVRPARNPLRILILGGTGFIGPHQVEYALKRGHTVTLFNRGQTRPHLFPDVEKLRGDRNDNLEALKGREWDVVIDNPAMTPDWVRLSAGVLRDTVQQYVFISTLSVFADDGIVDQDETGVVGVYDEEAGEVVTGSAYGGRKALCENTAEEFFPGRTTVVRPGLITGPGDPTVRFPYWPIRVDRGGEVLVPGEYADPVQWIDARDLGEFTLSLCERSVYGIFNTCSQPFPMGDMLEEIRDGLGVDATFTWATEEFLREQGVLNSLGGLGSTMVRNPDYTGYNQYNVDKAVEAGLSFRPIGVTARDTVDWYHALPEDERPRGRMLSAEREAEVLAAWHERG